MKYKRIVSLGLNYFRFGSFDGKFLQDNSIDTVRLNFSHMEYDVAEKTVNLFRDEYKGIKILQDLQGQKWRVGKDFQTNGLLVKKDDEVYFCSNEKYLSVYKNNTSKIFIPIQMDGSFSSLRDCKKISMKDGSMEFDVLENKAETDEYISAQANDSIMVRPEKSINIPDVARTELTALTKKDEKDLEWGIKNKMDIIVLSFVNKKEDIIHLKEFIKERLEKNQKMPIIWAKIETRDGYKNFKAILKESDGVMLGRGDLIPELGRFESSTAQYDMLDMFKKADSKNDFIIATHTFDSLISKFNLYPSITNLNDIHQSVACGATGFMLTNEVGYGKQPRKSIEYLNNYLAYLEKNKK
jgi:pyruvate kinase